MFFFENVRLAFGALVQNKMRSLLTMLGIIIGISAVITITTIGNSLQKTITNLFALSGNNGYYLSYNTKPDENGDYYSYYDLRSEDYVTAEMLDALYEEFDGKYLVSQEEAFGMAELQNSKGQRIRASVDAVTEGLLRSYSQQYKLLSGRYLTEQDSRKQKNAIMVSDLFVQQYFLNGEEPLNQSITLDVSEICSADFVIVGVYEHPKMFDKMLQPGTALMDKMSMMFIPYGTALRLTSKKNEVSTHPQIVTQDPTLDYELVKPELQAFFDRQFASNKKLSVTVKSDAEDMKVTSIVMTVITVMISVIAAISLLVGGIGVMNIMLVSITERTREIGVRKAIGAKSSTIRTQFVIEAVILCLIGGVVGILIGLCNGLLIGALGNYAIHLLYEEYEDFITLTIQPSVLAILLSIGFSMLIGVFFGSYPASKAAKLNPIDALRYE